MEPRGGGGGFSVCDCDEPNPTPAELHMPGRAVAPPAAAASPTRPRTRGCVSRSWAMPGGGRPGCRVPVTVTVRRCAGGVSWSMSLLGGNQPLCIRCASRKHTHTHTRRTSKPGPPISDHHHPPRNNPSQTREPECSTPLHPTRSPKPQTRHTSWIQRCPGTQSESRRHTGGDQPPSPRKGGPPRRPHSPKDWDTLHTTPRRPGTAWSLSQQ